MLDGCAQGWDGMFEHTKISPRSGEVDGMSSENLVRTKQQLSQDRLKPPSPFLQKERAEGKMDIYPLYLKQRPLNKSYKESTRGVKAVGSLISNKAQ